MGSRVLEHAEHTPNKSSKDNEKARSQAGELGSHLSTLDADWGRQLRENPGLIWEEATAFNLTSLLAKHGGIHVQLLQSGPPPAVVGYAPMNRVPRLTLDGENDVVLGVCLSR
jgi:hypothetical protein